jgi:hypothetical protein
MGKVDAAKIPAGARCAGRKIENKEEHVGAGGNSSSKGSGGKSGSGVRSRGAVGRRDRKGVHRSKRGVRVGDGGINEQSGLRGTGHVTGSRKRGRVREPDFIILLDVEVVFQWV